MMKVHALCVASLIASVAQAATEYSPHAGETLPNRVLFGDTHLHTSYSTDAGMIGNRLGPEEALRFAKGEEVISSMGVKAKLARPLDFLVISDHAENLGLAPALVEQNADLLATDFGKQLADRLAASDAGGAFWLWLTAMNAQKDPLVGMSFAKNMWQRLTTAVEKHNQPGRFTALIGYEWTAGPGGNNLHRNVIFRDGKDKADQIVPFSQYDSNDAEDLWRWLANYESNTGGKVLAIAHNGNLSNGLMFDDVTLTSRKPLDKDYAERRRRWEPIYEVTQIKGDGEAHPLLSPSDEFANFEKMDKASLGGNEPKTPDMLPKEYAREALKRGLAYEAKLGVNPFKFGMIGSTDSHTSLSTAEENNFFGKVSMVEPSAAARRFDELITGRDPKAPASIKQEAWRTSASGLAAVWARDNTREAIWDAFARKEVYATTGTRLEVRVFAGFDFSAADLARSDFVANGYRKGVPMGGDLGGNLSVGAGNTPLKSAKAPGFLVRAARSADGANLDRIQMIKGWLDKSGKAQEKIYDITWAGTRKIGKSGKLPAVGNTVNVQAATYSNSIGAPVLEAFWKDPAFKAEQRAFYYVRVIEIPTPRWTVYDAKVFGTTPPKEAPTSIQDRAYTSPIWYSPSS